MRIARVPRRRLKIAIAVSVLTATAACGSVSGPAGGDMSTTAWTPPFVVAVGQDGVALIGDGWFEPVAGVPADAYAWPGPVGVAVDARTAVLVDNGRIALVRAHEPATAIDCVDCAGVAFATGRIVTTRKNYTPGEGFDIVTFDAALQNEHSVRAERLAERAATEYPAENTESPITLAADERTVTVGYLSRNGGDRRGPSIVAQYDYTGRLLRNISVDGRVGRSVVSPDGSQLALDVDGSGGACITISRPTVIDLRTLGARQLQPEVPSVVRAHDPLQPPWFDLTDMDWKAGTLVATGAAMAPTPDEDSGCDKNPAIFERTFDVATGELRDTPVTALATRRLGAACADVVTVVRNGDDVVLDRGPDVRLGRYAKLGPAPSTDAGC
jgi:hypothetical protein